MLEFSWLLILYYSIHEILICSLALPPRLRLSLSHSQFKRNAFMWTNTHARTHTHKGTGTEQTVSFYIIIFIFILNDLVKCALAQHVRRAPMPLRSWHFIFLQYDGNYDNSHIFQRSSNDSHLLLLLLFCWAELSWAVDTFCICMYIKSVDDLYTI